MILRHLARILAEVQEAWPLPSEEHPHLGPLLTLARLRLGRHPRTAAEWEEVLLDLLAGEIAEGWDRWGAPSVARHPEKAGVWVGSFEGPGGPHTVEAGSKREAYREIRRAWVRRLLQGPIEGV